MSIIITEDGNSHHWRWQYHCRRRSMKVTIHTTSIRVECWYRFLFIRHKDVGRRQAHRPVFHETSTVARRLPTDRDWCWNEVHEESSSDMIGRLIFVCQRPTTTCCYLRERKLLDPHSRPPPTRSALTVRPVPFRSDVNTARRVHVRFFRVNTSTPPPSKSLSTPQLRICPPYKTGKFKFWRSGSSPDNGTAKKNV